MEKLVQNAVCLFVLCVALSESSVALNRTSSACYSAGGNCAFHSLSCAQGLVISLRDLQFGFKEDKKFSEYHCESVENNCLELVSRPDCCQYNVTRDCAKGSDRDLVNFRNQCDGRINCNPQATRIAGGCERDPFHYSGASTFSVVTYICQNVTESNVTSSESNVTPSESHATSSMTLCDDGNCATTTEAERETTKVQNGGGQRDLYRDDGRLQLIIGVSVGVGSGVISLVIIAAVCWLRMRRKPPSTFVQGSRTSSLHHRTNNHLMHSGGSSTLGNQTLTSSIGPTSIYSDTFPSSSHQDSVYSLPLDLSNPSTMGRASFVRQYGYSVNQGFEDGETNSRFDRDPPSGLSAFEPLPGTSGLRADLAKGMNVGGGMERIAGVGGSVGEGFVDGFRHPPMQEPLIASPPAPSVAESIFGYSNLHDLAAFVRSRSRTDSSGSSSGRMFGNSNGPTLPTTVQSLPPNSPILPPNSPILPTSDPAITNNNYLTHTSREHPMSTSTPQHSAELQNRVEMLSGVFSLVSLQLGNGTRRSVQSLSEPLSLTSQQPAPPPKQPLGVTRSFDSATKPSRMTDDSAAMQYLPSQDITASSGLPFGVSVAASNGRPSFGEDPESDAVFAEQDSQTEEGVDSARNLISAHPPPPSPPPNQQQANAQLLDLLRSHISDQIGHFAHKSYQGRPLNQGTQQVNSTVSGIGLSQSGIGMSHNNKPTKDNSKEDPSGKDVERGTTAASYATAPDTTNWTTNSSAGKETTQENTDSQKGIQPQNRHQHSSPTESKQSEAAVPLSSPPHAQTNDKHPNAENRQQSTAYENLKQLTTQGEVTPVSQQNIGTMGPSQQIHDKAGRTRSGETSKISSRAETTPLSKSAAS